MNRLQSQRVIESLITQRNAVATGIYVNHKPRSPGEACLAFRYVPGVYAAVGVNVDSYRIIRDSLRTLFPEESDTIYLWDWNDSCGTRDKALAVLDEAIRRAKELDNADVDLH